MPLQAGSSHFKPFGKLYLLIKKLQKIPPCVNEALWLIVTFGR